jgi:hypothetical protein
MGRYSSVADREEQATIKRGAVIALTSGARALDDTSAAASTPGVALARTWRNGRRKGLKIPWGKPCEGSSPSVRTNIINSLDGCEEFAQAF